MVYNKKGSVVVLCIWLIVVLSIFALSLSRRASVELSWIKYNKRYLACKTASFNALMYMNSKLNAMDNAEELNVYLSDPVKIPMTILGEELKLEIMVSDAESLFDINMIGKEVLSYLLLYDNIVESTEEAENISDSIIAWRTPHAEEEEFAQTEEFIKGDNIVYIEELVLIEGLDYNKLNKLENWLTLWSDDGKININHCRQELMFFIEEITESVGFAQVAMDLRSEEDGISIEDLNALKGGFPGVKDIIKNESKFYRIVVNARCQDVEYSIMGVWDSSNKRVEFYGII